ncbi:secreted frizzled-related protein 5-like [Hetaerina americana]|uniref:secreted frizzled-related protein 5-like n=1 Tax=Hetaerina americana TaxID=62018 RepID=UPI003A7F2C2F
MTLCRGIGYHKMRLPNLLDHDTMLEVSQQAVSWVPLLNVRCHPDTQLLLCSLFSPVCLDRPIYPCRSLCEKVKLGCEGRMKMYGFPWPEMLKCAKFPLDNDMCIAPQSHTDPGHGNGCQACNQAETYENILDNFCRADFAVRAKIRRARKAKLTCKKAKVLKSTHEREYNRQLRRPVLMLNPVDTCCEEITRNSKHVFLIMGYTRDAKLIPSFIMPWGKNSKPFKKAVRMFKKLNCSDPKIVSHSVIGEAFRGSPSPGRRKRGKNKGQSRKSPSTLLPDH